MQLQIRLLGHFEIGFESGPAIRLPTRKAEALLAFLSARPGVRHGRERLAALLWPESSAARARASLRQTLGLARKSLQSLDAPGLCVSGGDLYLDPAGIDVDAVALDRAVADGSLAALERTVALYRGELPRQPDAGQ